MSGPASQGATSSASFALPGLGPGVTAIRQRWSRQGTHENEGQESVSFQSSVESVWGGSTGPTGDQSISLSTNPSPKRSRSGTSSRSVRRRSNSTAGPPPSSSHSHTRPTTSASLAGAEGSWICAVLESRGTGREVGIAMLEQHTGHCILTQFADTQTYVRTVHHLATHPPAVILVPSSTSSNALAERQALGKQILVQCLEDAFGLEVVGMGRGAWNHDQGARYLDRLLVDHPQSEDESSRISGQRHASDGEDVKMEDEEWTAASMSHSEIGAEVRTRAAILTATTGRYYALSACAALFQYLESTGNQAYRQQSLNIRYLPAEGKWTQAAQAEAHSLP